jgi:hypothetical protein
MLKNPKMREKSSVEVKIKKNFEQKELCDY